jgi:MarR family transcriptional regulator, lower aerobic nicotinate degradation pathway regulator
VKKRVSPLPATSDVLAVAAQETGFLLQRTHRRLRAALAEALVPLHLGVGHFAVLGLLFARGGLSQQQLIEILEIDKSSMVYLIDELEKQGLAQRRPAPGDRRAYAVHLTDTGRERVATGGEIVRRVQSQFLAPLKARERTQLNQLLRRLAT